MDAVWQELIRAVPWGAVIIILRWLDIKEKTVERHERENNARDKASQDRETQQVIAKAYADAINALAKVTELSSNNIVSTINEFKSVMIEKYDDMGITKELLEMARIRIQEQPKDKR